jgi:hypothetical protein
MPEAQGREADLVEMTGVVVTVGSDKAPVEWVVEMMMVL